MGGREGSSRSGLSFVEKKRSGRAGFLSFTAAPAPVTGRPAGSRRPIWTRTLACGLLLSGPSIMVGTFTTCGSGDMVASVRPRSPASSAFMWAPTIEASFSTSSGSAVMVALQMFSLSLREVSRLVERFASDWAADVHLEAPGADPGRPGGGDGGAAPSCERAPQRPAERHCGDGLSPRPGVRQHAGFPARCPAAHRPLEDAERPGRTTAHRTRATFAGRLVVSSLRGPIHHPLRGELSRRLPMATGW